MKITCNASKIQTLVVCKINKWNILSYQSFICIFRNFKEYQKLESGGLKKQVKRQAVMEEAGGISSKIRTLLVHIFFVQMVAKHRKNI